MLVSEHRMFDGCFITLATYGVLSATLGNV